MAAAQLGACGPGALVGCLPAGAGAEVSPEGSTVENRSPAHSGPAGHTAVSPRGLCHHTAMSPHGLSHRLAVSPHGRVTTRSVSPHGCWLPEPSNPELVRS